MAFLRAVAEEGGTTVRDFHDPVARRMLSLPWSLGLDLAKRGLRRPSIRKAFAEIATRGLDGVALRTRAIDEAWNGRGDDFPQLVILGAGLDGRAWRLAGFERVFEVDHPATQNYKRHRAADLPAPKVDLRWIAADLNRDDLKSAMAQMDFDPKQRSFWIWEGVIPYLTPETLRKVLSSIASCSAPGSRLVATYIPPSSAAGTARVLKPVRGLFHLFGEPFLALLRPDEVRELLAQTGFAVVSDTGAKDWATRFSDRASAFGGDIGERLVIAERVG